MSRETRNAGLSLLLSLLIVGTASLSARLYRDQQEAQVAQAQILAASSVACR